MTIHSNKSESGRIAYTVGVGRHAIQVDESTEHGGDDLGPTPHDLFDAALAACTSLTLTLYAQRKGWPLEDVRVEVTRDASKEAQGEYHLARKIDLIGTLDPEQRDRLRDIAERCPIHRLMHAKIVITTEPA